MNNTNNEEIKLINGQLIATFIFIISLIVSLIITYNEKLQKENKKPFFTNKESINIALLNRIILLILGGYFVYDAFRRKILAKENANNNNDSFSDLTSNLQITASWFTFISSVIILFIIILNYNNLNFDISGTEGDNI